MEEKLDPLSHHAGLALPAQSHHDLRIMYWNGRWVRAGSFHFLITESLSLSRELNIVLKE